MIYKIELLFLFGKWLTVISATYSREYRGLVFTLPDASKTQIEAQKWCQANGSKLMEVYNSDIQNLNIQFANDKPNDISFTNLYLTSGKRYDSRWIWVNGKDIRSVTLGDQKSYADSFGYLKSTSNGFKVIGTEPTNKRGYICQGDLYCTSGVSINGSCYKSYSETLSWYEARNRCLEEEGGDLASFDFIPDNAGLKTLNGSWISQSTEYWIGIYRQWWTWQGSGSEVRYSQWQEWRPIYVQGDQCICLDSSKNWKWIECDCNSPYPFICLSGTLLSTYATSSSTKAPESTTLTTNSPHSSTSIKEQIPSTAASTANSNNSVLALGVGLGVGIGGGLLLAALIVVAVILFRKHGFPFPRKSPSKRQPQSPDVTLHPSSEPQYAEVPKQFQNETITTILDNNVQYAAVDHGVISTTSDKEHPNSISLAKSKTATLVPPTANIEPNHVFVNGEEYAEINKDRPREENSP